MRVRRRRVIFVQGYDPRGLAQYYRMFRTELRKFDSLYKWQSTLGRPEQDSERPIASWTVTTQTDAWQTDTTYDFLRWDDVIAPDFARPAWRTIGYAFFALGSMIVGGGLRRVWQANWRFMIFSLYPFALFGALMGLAALISFAFSEAFLWLGLPHWLVFLFGAGVFAFALVALLRVITGPSYLLYMMADGGSTFQFASGKRPDWDQRIDVFARYLVEVCKTSDADEILIVGQSSGSFIAVEIVGRALLIDPELARRGTLVSLLTLGANFPLVGYVAAATGFRENLRRVAFQNELDWVDCQSRIDVMNFFQYDPIVGHRLDDGTPRRNPLIVEVRFREAILAENFFRFRWAFFRVHVQFIMANERVYLYDFFMIVTGPVSLRTRFEDPDSTIKILHHDENIKRAALDKIAGIGLLPDCP